MRVVVDTSAIVAILQDEPEGAAFLDRLAAAEAVLSAGTLVETLRVMRLRRRDVGVARVWDLIDAQEIAICELDRAQAELAEEGMRRFGKGRGSPPAVLNFGDLFAYALARHVEAPLLFKGNDFSQTDITPALPLA
jgi:ribonuclease VapC